jgi:thioredoxin-dependent peroxiredoxin
MKSSLRKPIAVAWLTSPVVVLLVGLGASLRVGAAPADFTVEAPADGSRFTLSAARGKFVALHFLLKTECPFCLKHTRDYARASAATPDVVHVFLKPDTAEEIKSWSAKANRGADIPDVAIYRDPDARLAGEYGIPGGYAFHGQSVHYPALVVLDPAGKEVFRYVGKSNSDRFSQEQFATQLAEWKRKPAAGVQHYNVGADKLAIHGYDPVAYVAQSRALKGRKDLTAEHQGITYLFASPENQRRFLESPAKHLPAYGGWCATAMAKGEKVEVDPSNYKVTQGRVFLFFKAFYANAIKDWNKDEAALTAKADAHWSRLAGE